MQYFYRCVCERGAVFCARYMKGLPFLSKWDIKSKVKGLELGAGPPSIQICWVHPPPRFVMTLVSPIGDSLIHVLLYLLLCQPEEYWLFAVTFQNQNRLQSWSQVRILHGLTTNNWPQLKRGVKHSQHDLAHRMSSNTVGSCSLTTMAGTSCYSQSILLFLCHKTLFPVFNFSKQPNIQENTDLDMI